ncbi:hypothetical protein ACLBW0_08535 [Enterobacteriaceae bacterium C34A]
MKMTSQLTPEQLCEFVARNYGQYQGAYLCGKASEILNYLLNMAGFSSQKMAVNINGTGHIFIRCNGLYLDPTIKQFGDYPEITTEYPLTYEVREKKVLSHAATGENI